VAKRYANVKQGASDKISKSKKLDPTGFCPTLRAGTGKDKGSYQAVRPIHPTKNRVITPREAARLQGFPDWFVFHKTKWHSFRQIGNSVSPIVAERLLNVIREKIKNNSIQEHTFLFEKW
jgi:DNA (cytosine-5)-methyltransferase 1